MDLITAVIVVLVLLVRLALWIGRTVGRTVREQEARGFPSQAPPPPAPRPPVPRPAGGGPAVGGARGRPGDAGRRKAPAPPPRRPAPQPPPPRPSSVPPIPLSEGQEVLVTSLPDLRPDLPALAPQGTEEAGRSISEAARFVEGLPPALGAARAAREPSPLAGLLGGAGLREAILAAEVLWPPLSRRRGRRILAPFAPLRP